MVKVKRAYDAPEESDGARVLVDRLWPRGLAKERAQVDEWLREVAPSQELRRWYGHEPARFPEFADRYRTELSVPERVAALDRLRIHLRQGELTLLTASRDLANAHTAVLAELLSGRT